MSGWDWLIVAGGVLQALGVGLVAVDLVMTKRRVDAYDMRPVVVKARAASVSASAAIGVLRTEGGREPTLEERVHHLEARVARLPEEMQEAASAVRDALREETQRAVRHQAEDTEERHRAIENLLRGVALGPLRLRWLGVTALLLGIAASTLGGVLG